MATLTRRTVNLTRTLTRTMKRKENKFFFSPKAFFK